MSGDLICFGIFVMICQPREPAPAPAPASSYCDIAKTMSWSAQDTRASKEQMDANNRVYKRLCMQSSKDVSR
jgi:hypothetical protein